MKLQISCGCLLGMLILLTSNFAKADQPVAVYILAGQSNMEGKAKVSLLQHQMMDPKTASEFSAFHENGQFIERDDVFIKFLGRHGKLTAGYGSKDRIGPELQFGFTIGDHHDQPVLIIKTAWGGKSLFRDFRPPSSGKPNDETIDKQLKNAQKKRPETTRDDIVSSYGEYYRQMISEVKTTLQEIDQYVPGENVEYEIKGLIWFQGWNDMVNPEYVAAYTENLANLIRDVRTDLGQSNLPFVVGVLGVGGLNEQPKNKRKEQFKLNQAAIGKIDEFRDTVSVVHTDQYWDETASAVFKKGWKENLELWETVGSDRPYHYLGSVRCYNRMGKAFAEAVLKLNEK